MSMADGPTTPRDPRLDRRAAHPSRGAPIGREITAIQPLLWFVPNRRHVHSSPLNGRKHPEQAGSIGPATEAVGPQLELGD